MGILTDADIERVPPALLIAAVRAQIVADAASSIWAASAASSSRSAPPL